MTAPLHMTEHPSDEAMAAFIDGRLDGDARERVVEHVAGCAECRESVLVADQYQQSSAAVLPSPTPSMPRRYPLIAAALAAAAAVVVVMATLLRTSPMDQLVDASEPLRFRPSSARLSADFPYRPTQPNLRSGNRPESDPSYARLWSAMADIQARAGDDASAAELHALGVSYLLAGKSNEAVITLEDALKRETRQSDIREAITASSNADLLNDLAAAYQRRIDRQSALELQPLAVEAVQRAWSLDDDNPQIAWTRAVVIESLNVRERAISAWRDYLALDPSSEWRQEAQRRLDALLQPTDADLWPATRERLATRLVDGPELRAAVDRFRQQVREWCEEELLPEWGRAVLQGDPAAPARLEKVARLGRALQETNGEGDVADAVAAIRRARTGEVRQLATGHAAYGAARAAIAKSAGARAIQEADTAVASLTPALTPFAWRARAERAAAAYTTQNFAQALDQLRTLSAEAPAPSRVLTGRMHWVRGIVSLRSGSPKEAVEDYLIALAAFRDAGETNAQIGLHSRLSAAYRELGKHQEAREHDHAALALLTRSGDARRTHEVLFEAAYTAIRNDHSGLADLLLGAVVEHDVATGDAVTACTSLMWRGSYRFRRGASDGAAADLRRAKAFCNAIEDTGSRRRALANLGLAAGMVGDQQGRADLDRAIEYYEGTDSRDWLRTAYVARARAASQHGDDTAAERDFRAAWAEMMATRSRIAEQTSRMSFTSTADETADAYVEFLLHRGREREAFEISDRSRARELVDSPSARWATSTIALTVSGVQAMLPPHVAIVKYRVLGPRVAAWVVAHDAFEARMLAAGYAETQRLVSQVSADMTESSYRKPAAALYDALLAPLKPLVGRYAVLVVVPDEELERVPFSALYDRESGRYVAETQTTFTNYSVGLFLQSASRFAERTVAGGDTMVVVEAAAAGAEVRSLPDAARETRALQSLFAQCTVLKGEQTTASAVLRAVGNATLLHFAGHGERAGADSAGGLRLADHSRLAPDAIATASLPRTRIAYMSACETDAGPVQKLEGSATTARAFFASGVPAVVATLWPVDDAVAHSVARVFYERLRAGAPPAEALRAAQLRVLPRSPESRTDWAAFRVIGAGIPFHNRSS